MGIALLAITSLKIFSVTGFEQKLIQEKNDISDYLDTAYWALALRGIFIAVLLYVLAPFIAIFFNTPMAEPLIQFIGLSEVFKGFSNIGVVYFQKDLKFHKEFFYQIIGTFTDFVVTVSLAIVFKSVWALAIGLVSGNLGMMLASFILQPYKPKLRLDMEKLSYMWKFGRWILFTSILVFLVGNGDNLFVGKILGVTALGFYQLAFRITNTSAKQIQALVRSLSFPLFSKMNDNISKLRESYFIILTLVSYTTLYLSGIIYSLANEVTVLFLGEKWLPVFPLLKILAMLIFLRTFSIGPLANAVGRPNITTRIHLVQVLLLAILIYPFSMRYGFVGTGFSVLIATIITRIIIGFEISKMLKCRFLDLLRVVLTPFICMLFMITAVIITKSAFGSIGFFEFILMGVLGTIVYIGCAALFDWMFNLGIKKIIFELIPKLKKAETA